MKTKSGVLLKTILLYLFFNPCSTLQQITKGIHKDRNAISRNLLLLLDLEIISKTNRTYELDKVYLQFLNKKGKTFLGVK